MRVPLRLPADTGTPVPAEDAGSGQNRPSSALPDGYGVKPVKQWEKMRGRAATAYVNSLLLVLTCVVVNVCTGPVPASLWPVAEGAGEAVRKAAGEAYGEAGGALPGAARRRTARRAAGGYRAGVREAGGAAKRAGHGGARRQKGAGKGASADGIRVIAIRAVSGRKLAENSGAKAGYWLTGRGCRDSVVVYLGNRETE